jgi:hypothetical protein
VPAPAQVLCDHAAEGRAEDRPHEGSEEVDGHGHAAGGGRVAVGDGAGADGKARGRPKRLQYTEADERFHVPREPTRDGSGGKDGRRHEHDAAAAVLVRERPPHQRHHSQHDEVAGDGGYQRCVAALQVSLHHRQYGRVRGRRQRVQEGSERRRAHNAPPLACRVLARRRRQRTVWYGVGRVGLGRRRAHQDRSRRLHSARPLQQGP